MRYIDVQWFHQSAAEPVRFVSELDDQRFEVRKLEFFRNGNVGVASATCTTLRTQLGMVPVPSLEEINADPQFKGIHVDPSEFELLWKRHVANSA